MDKPKLRPLEVRPIEYQGQQMLLLHDPWQLGDNVIAVPRPLGPLLVLMDGSRDEAALEAALQVRAGVRLAPGLLANFLAELDGACLLDNDRFRQTRAGALAAYRQAPFRAPTIAGAGFPSGPDEAGAWLQRYVDALPPAEPPLDDGAIRGIVSPHIDYQRGGPVYAEVWRATAQAVQEAELVILLGTDHRGGEGRVTLTRQPYATPWGVLPLDNEIVDALAAALGEEFAFGEELNHRNEHSIELAAVWLHYTRGGRPVPTVPILLGSFATFVAGEADPASHEPFARVVRVLGEALKARRTLVVAAADLAHVGPAFGAPHGVDFIAQAQLRSADERLLQTVYAGDAAAFFSEIQAEGDRRNVCGLPPIYLTLRLLGQASGEPAGYALCPADTQGTSFVTIAGAVLR